MDEIAVTHESMVLEVKGSHKLSALKSRLETPLEHVEGVRDGN